MEPPERLDAGAPARRQGRGRSRPCGRSTRDDVVFGQFEGYRDEDGVAAGLATETFVALRARDRQRPLARRPVPAAHRQGAGARAGASSRSCCASRTHDLFAGDATAAARTRSSFELTDDPQLAVERARQGARAGARARRRAPLHARRRARARTTSGLEAYERLLHDVMARRPPAVHARRRGRAPVGGRGAAARATRPSRSPTRRARWGPDAAPAARRAAAAGACRDEHLRRG